MQLSGEEVQELFDFSARRSAQRGCTSQIQIAGARVRLDCTGCARLDVPCQGDAECINAGRDACDQKTKKCIVRCSSAEADPCPERVKGSSCNTEEGKCEVTACAENIYIGTTSKICQDDSQCSDDPKKPEPGSCSKATGKQNGLCLSQIQPTNLYELATSNYLAGGGSGFRVLQRNTTQFDTKVQQRDALIDYLRQGKPCGYDPKAGTDDGLHACSTDKDCDARSVCACIGNVKEASPDVCQTDGSCDSGAGRCVLRTCRDSVAAFHNLRCAGLDASRIEECKVPLSACQLGGEECKLLSCIDATVGNFSDGRVEMIGR
jgi:5'-nucleotidase